MDNSYYYFKKYCKYKKKYLDLKQKGGQDFTDINTNIYLKFITEKLIALLPTELIELEGGQGKRRLEPLEDDILPDIKTSKYPVRIREKPVYFKDYIENLTPQILDYLTPISKVRMEHDIEVDNEIIKKLKNIEEKEDPAYIAYENYGKLIEAWIADNMRCPTCKENSLRRYSSDSMPVIDLVCINPLHTINLGVKFFQVKTSNGALFLGKPYFNYNPVNPEYPNANTIHVGSRKWGNPVHTISPYDNEFNKKILCGYICIRYLENEETIRINLANSMIVLPSYLLSEKPARRALFLDSDKSEVETLSPTINPDYAWYYKYIEPNETHQRIKFNLNTNMIMTNDEIKILLPNITFNKSYPIRTDIMLNPLSIFDL